MTILRVPSLAASLKIFSLSLNPRLRVGAIRTTKVGYSETKAETPGTDKCHSDVLVIAITESGPV